MRIAAFAIVVVTTLALAGCTKLGLPEYQGLPDGIVSANGDLAFTGQELQEFTRIPEMPDTGILLDPYQPQGALVDVGLTRDETTVVWPETVTQSGKGTLRSGEEFTVTATYDQNRLYHIAVGVERGNLNLAVLAARECRLFGFTNFVKRMKQRAAGGEDMREICLAGEKYILNAYEREILIKLYVNVVPDESVTLGVHWAYEGDFEPIPEFKPPPPPADSEERQREAEELREKQMEEARRRAEEQGLPPPPEMPERPREPRTPEAPGG